MSSQARRTGFNIAKWVQRIGDPVAGAGEALIYAKDASGTAQLFCVGSDNVPVRVGGPLNFSSSLGGVNNPTKVGAAFALMPDMSVTLTTEGGVVLILWSGVIESQNNDEATMRLTVDGGAVGEDAEVTMLAVVGGTIRTTPVLFHVEMGLAPGLHTFQAEWSSGGGTARGVAKLRTITAMEL